jgi:hypothetical protein
MESDLPRITDYITETYKWGPQAGEVFKGLKEYLTQAIQVAEQQEKAVAAGLQPQTKAEAQALETRLKQALEEVSAMKAKLK